MARSDVNLRGLPLLNRWPEIMHETGWRFNQLSGDGVRQVANCQNHVYIQYERDYIAQALLDAATQAREYLGYPPAPMWIEDETVILNGDYAWNSQTLQTRYGQVQAFGRRATTLITGAVSVSSSDADDDGLDETASVSVSGVTAIAAEEIQVFFRTADGAPSAASEVWQIEGLTVTKSGDTATLTGPKWLFAHPLNVWREEYTKTDNAANWRKFEGDAHDADSFVTAVDVYRVYADPMSAALLQLTPDGSVTTPVAATADIIDSEYGFFTLRTGATQSAPGSNPRTVRVSYKAGLPLVNGRMDAQLETAIARYANTLMPQMPELCDRGAAMWKEDSSQSPNAAAYDAWHPPAFGISRAGMKLLEVVSARQNALKGRTLRYA